ncbi:unnamed protein product, partial [Adineta ricciae]
TTHFQKPKHSPIGQSYGSNHSRQVELSAAIVNDLIISLGLPLSIVDRSAFINFMSKVDPKFTVTSRRTLTRKTIPILYEQMKNRLKMLCTTATFLSLTLDVWTDRRMRSFFAVSAHAIVDGNFRSFVVCFTPLWGSHSSSLLLEKYEEIVSAFGIKDKVIRLVTDNAANNISAFQDIIIPGFEQYFIQDENEYTSDENDDIQANDGDISDEYEYPPEQLSTTTSSPNTDLTSEDLIQESLKRLMENNEAFRIPCFAHTIQLVVKDGLKQCQSIIYALEKVSAIAKLAHTSTKFAERLDAMKVSIPRAVITRWNSQFLTVERILTIPSIELNETLVQLKYKHLCLNARDLSMLQEFVSLLSLLAQATTATQRQKTPSISFVAPSILAIYFDLLNEKKHVQHTTTICDALLCSLISRFGGLLEQMEIDVTGVGVNFQINKKFYDLYKDPVFLFTPFLDGMFKVRWITESLLDDSSKERLCEKVKKLVFDHCLLIDHGTLDVQLVDPTVTESRQEVQGTSSSSLTMVKRKCLFGNIEHDLTQIKKPKTVDSFNYIKEEICRYINDDDNSNMVLINSTTSHSYKTLAKLAVKYLCIPATSAAVERVFSQSGFLFRSHRARMSRKTLKQLTLLKCNDGIV